MATPDPRPLSHTPDVVSDLVQIPIGENPEMAPRGILDYRSVELTDSHPAGGTNGARVALDDEGTEWLVKHYQGNPDRVATELLANAIYRELDILVPEAGIGIWEGPNGEEWITATYPMLEGEFRRWTEPDALLAEGFVADALLANWDVIGLLQDNILWQGEVPIRLDQGGCFEFRAQGEPKPYGPEVVELERMRSGDGQAVTSMAVTRELIEESAASVALALGRGWLTELVAEAPFKNEAMAGRVERNLIARLRQLAESSGRDG